MIFRCYFWFDCRLIGIGDLIEPNLLPKKNFELGLCGPCLGVSTDQIKPGPIEDRAWPNNKNLSPGLTWAWPKLGNTKPEFGPKHKYKIQYYIKFWSNRPRRVTHWYLKPKPSPKPHSGLFLRPILPRGPRIKAPAWKHSGRTGRAFEPAWPIDTPTHVPMHISRGVHNLLGVGVKTDWIWVGYWCIHICIWFYLVDIDTNIRVFLDPLKSC